jgi:hypothetical protein
MAGIYYDGDFSVTVNDDHSIRVRPGDWISKYADAIYKIPGMQSYWKRFKRKVGGQFIDLTNYHKIEVGEDIWHPDPLPPPDVRLGPGQQPEEPSVPREEIDPGRLSEFFYYLRQLLTPVSGWQFLDSQGADLGIKVFAANYSRIQARQRGAARGTWFHAVGAGVGLGLDLGGSLAVSIPGDFSAGFVAKFPTAGGTLSVEEICGSYALLDVSAGCVRGRSLALMLFGLNTPWDMYINMLRYLRGEGEFPTMIPHIFTGVIGMWGHSWALPNAGFSIKCGSMHRFDCITPW